MSVLQDQIERTLRSGMSIPGPLQLLFTWIEESGLFVDRNDGRVGYLFPEDELRSGWTDTERPGGTIIEFAAEGNVNLHYWFGHDRPEILDRLCVFAQTGADGSMAAFWIDDDGKQRIVHLGSGSGSTLVCVLADDPVDFLRLLAIGYDEVCWDEQFANPPNEPIEKVDLIVHPNIRFREWVMRTFSVTIPSTALQIIRHPAKMGDAKSPDPFWQWVEKNSA
jgi:hypothetical protein